MAKLVFPQALGNAAAMYFLTPCGLVIPRIWSKQICIYIKGNVLLKYSGDQSSHQLTRILHAKFRYVVFCNYKNKNAPDYKQNEFEYRYSSNLDNLPACALPASPLSGPEYSRGGEQSTFYPAENFHHNHFQMMQSHSCQVCEQP